MIRLDLSYKDKWLDLGRGVRVKVHPPLSSIAAQVWQEMAQAGAFEDDTDIDAGVLEAKAWARRVIVEWEGVGDADGEVLEKPAPALVDALMDVPWVYLAFRALYLAPLHELESEKNASAMPVHARSRPRAPTPTFTTCLPARFGRRS